MKINEIRSSGLLEQYALKLLSAEEQLQVERYLVDFPELKADIFDIEQSLHQFARSKGITPRLELESQMTSYVMGKGNMTPSTKPNSDIINPTSKYSNWLLLSMLLGLAALGTLWYGYNKITEYDTLQQKYAVLQLECDSLVQEQQIQLINLKAINDINSNQIDFTPTEGYNQTKLRLHYNPQTKKNFIKIANLPTIPDDHAFQLWALKDGEAPIPLNVFKGEQSDLIEVDFVDNTATYAITIEVLAGAQSPTLARLIGTASTAG